MNVGTNAALIAPSAKRSRTRFGNAERDDEGVHLVAGAEERREHLIASQAEDAAGERGRAGHAGGSRQPPAWDLDHAGQL